MTGFVIVSGQTKMLQFRGCYPTGFIKKAHLMEKRPKTIKEGIAGIGKFLTIGSS